MKIMDVFIGIVGGVLLVAVILSSIVDILQHRKLLNKIVEQEGRIKFLEENAYIRGDRGRFQKLIPKVESTVPTANG